MSLEEVRAYILVRQSMLPPDDKKRIVVEQGGALAYDKVRSAMRLLGSKFFGELQGQRSATRNKTYDINFLEPELMRHQRSSLQGVATLEARNGTWTWSLK